MLKRSIEVNDKLELEEEYIDKMIEELEQGVLEAEISDYIFWSEMTSEEIADKVLHYKPIKL